MEGRMQLTRHAKQRVYGGTNAISHYYYYYYYYCYSATTLLYVLLLGDVRYW